MKDLKGLKRVLLKLSGEALAGEKKTGFDEETVLKVAEQVKQIVDDGVQVAIVISGEEEPARTWKEPRQIRLVCLQL